MKWLVFLRAGIATARGELQDWVLHSHVPRLIACGGGLQRVVVDLVVDTPRTIAYRPVSDPGAASGPGARPAFDVVVQVWATAQEAIAPWLDSRELRNASEVVHAYAVSETVIWDREPVRQGVLPGIKYLALLRFHDDLADCAARRSWALHASLARRVHIGCSRYVQNWIDTPVGEDCLLARGIPELYFPTEADLIERFFDSPRGRDEVLHETQHFILSGPRLYAREHVLLG